MKISNLHNKNILIVVAHQDDEALFAGGLMSSLKGKANLHVVCMSKPKKGRADTETREEAFKNVCDMVGAKHYLTKFKDFGQYMESEKEKPIEKQLPKMTKFLKKLILDNDINVIISHSEHGENDSHAYHKVVHQSCVRVLEDFTELCFLTFGVGNFNWNKLEKFIVRYSVSMKKKLLEFYHPWKPRDEEKPYAPERFIIERKLTNE